MSESHDTKSFRIDYRHLTFFFLGAVCVCAVFFALGFVVGRAQAFETALQDGTRRACRMALSAATFAQRGIQRGTCCCRRG